jgi:hypothetical protein
MNDFIFSLLGERTYKFFCKVETRVVDPHHFIANLDPYFHLNADPDRVLIKVMGICDHRPTDPPGLHFEPPGLNCGSPRLNFEPLKLLNFDFINVDADPALHCTADPDLASQNNEIHADPDPQPCLKLNEQNTGLTSFLLKKSTIHIAAVPNSQIISWLVSSLVRSSALSSGAVSSGRRFDPAGDKLFVLEALYQRIKITIISKFISESGSRSRLIPYDIEAIIPKIKTKISIDFLASLC